MTENGKNILRSYIVRAGDTYKDAAECAGVTEKFFTKMMNHYNGAKFTMDQAKRLIGRYSISESDAMTIFFANEVS